MGAADRTVISTGERAELEPGQWVLNPARPDWGLGQVQSAVGARVTVNFEHAGKVLVDTAAATLVLTDPDAVPTGR
ncbi:MAG TPA: DUF3553 domain-containing protein [Acidisphaera sp.]|nr:DUF3553 domain-containing protein [Acidisphaera sp.]